MPNGPRFYGQSFLRIRNLPSFPNRLLRGMLKGNPETKILNTEDDGKTLYLSHWLNSKEIFQKKILKLKIFLSPF